MNYTDLCQLIDQQLPGQGVWFQSAATEEAHRGVADGEPEAEGLAIRKLSGYWIVSYFRMVKDPWEEGEGWRLDAGYTGEYDTLQQAKAEAAELVRYLPSPAFIDREANRRMILATLEELDEPQH
jgi:hypothetical protein